MWNLSHAHTHHTINQIEVSQSRVSEPTWGYQAGSDTICNDPRTSTSHIYTIPQKDQSQLKLLAVVNKAQFKPVNTQCGTHHIPTHITQSIKLEHHNRLKLSKRKQQTNYKYYKITLYSRQITIFSQQILSDKLLLVDKKVILSGWFKLEPIIIQYL